MSSWFIPIWFSLVGIAYSSSLKNGEKAPKILGAVCLWNETATPLSNTISSVSPNVQLDLMTSRNRSQSKYCGTLMWMTHNKTKKSDWISLILKKRIRYPDFITKKKKNDKFMRANFIKLYYLTFHISSH